jgi:hypothetical protein
MGRGKRGFRKFLHEKLHVPYYSRHIIRAMKSEKMRQAGIGGRRGEERCMQGFGWEF